MSILDQVLYVLDNNIYSEELLMAEYNNDEKPPAKNKCSKMSKVPDTGQEHRNDEDNEGDDLHVDTDDSEFELEGLDDIDLIDERKIKKLVKSEETILEELGHLWILQYLQGEWEIYHLQFGLNMQCCSVL